MKNTPPSDQPVQRITTGRRLLRFFFGLAFILLVLIGTIFTVISLPMVQRYGVDWLTTRISHTTGTRFEIQSFKLTWQGDLEMENVFVQGLDGDTLLVAGALALGSFGMSPVCSVVIWLFPMS